MKPAAAFTNTEFEKVVFMSASQMGKTELIFSVMGHRMDDGPRVPQMYVGSSQKNVRTMSKDRISKMIRTSPSLYARLHKGQSDGLYEKYFAEGVRMGFAWPSANELASHPCGLVNVDELDRMDSNIDGEGDPVAIVSARTKNYYNAKVGIFSTPTIEGASAIYMWWSEGTKHQYCHRCPDCDDWFAPRLALLRWPKEGTAGERADRARLTCAQCGCEIQNHERKELEDDYQPYVFDDDNRLQRVDIAPKNSVASFWAHGLHSPWVSYAQVAEAMIRAYATRDPDRVQGVVNTMGGEPYVMDGDAPDWEELYKKREPYAAGHAPRGTQMITMGVDVQKDRLYYTIRGFGFLGESWLIQNGALLGRTDYDDVWLKLTLLMTRQFDGLPIERIFIDSGWRPGIGFERPAHKVYDFCRNHYNAFPTKGQPDGRAPVWDTTVDADKDGGRLKIGLQLWHINTHYWKVWLYDKIRTELDQPGAFHIHQDVDKEYCRQVCSESLLTLSSGKMKWKVDYKQNHGLDCEVLAAAAAWTCGLYELPDLEVYEAVSSTPTEAPPAPEIVPPGRSIWD